MFIDTQSDITARKNCLALFGDLKIKSLNDIRAHELPWSDLCATEKRIATTARNLLDKIGDKTAEDQRESIEDSVDSLTLVLDLLRFEKDQRMELGSKEPRAMGGSNNRPGAEAGRADPGGFESEAAEPVYALEPEQRFTTWARAKSHDADAFRGLSLGSYLRSMVLGGKTDLERRALSEGSDSAGGYTTPTPLSAELIDLLRAASVAVRAGARTVPLTSDNNHVATLLTDPAPAWRDEAGAVAESDPTFGLINMVPRSLAVQVKLSAELFEDSLNLTTELPRVLAAAMAVELDRVALLGSGTPPEPRGVANTSNIGTTAVDAPLTAWAPFVAARTGILSANAGPVTAFVMHPRDQGVMDGLLDTTNQPLMAPKSIADVPQLTTTSIPVDGGTGTDESTILVGNFAHLLIGIRSDVRVEVLKTTAYASNLQYTLLAFMRADIAVTHPGAFYTLTGVGAGA